MEVEVYADLLFLINAGMDGLCFCLTGKLLHRKLSPWRVIVGALLGGVYAVAALLLDTGQAVSLCLDVGVCLLMCGLVFGGRTAGRGRRVLLSTGVYFVLSMVLGGIMTALYHLLNRAGVASLLAEWFSDGGSDSGDGPGAWLFLLLTAVGGAVSLWGGRLFRRSVKATPCRVTVMLDGRTAVLEGMVDTGNLLRDPVGGRAVICADGRGVAEILSPELYAVMRGQDTGMSSLSLADARRVRVIPAGTATGDGMLYGFLPDAITVTVEGQAERQVNAVVAVTVLDGMSALVPSDL